MPIITMWSDIVKHIPEDRVIPLTKRCVIPLHARYCLIVSISIFTLNKPVMLTNVSVNNGIWLTVLMNEVVNIGLCSLLPLCI